VRLFLNWQRAAKMPDVQRSSFTGVAAVADFEKTYSLARTDRSLSFTGLHGNFNLNGCCHQKDGKIF
jgi:hypothetical protein